MFIRRWQNEDPSLYPCSYLVTAPKFLGYNFNPVSFWYLYDGDMQLKAMILEVNNTFDERRPYFLKNETMTSDTGEALDPERPRETAPASQGFSNKFRKDFHVSPLNSRKGYYALEASDPIAPSEAQSPSIRNIITLSSSKNHPKLVANILSKGQAIDPSGMTAYDTWLFVSTWWWVGFMTFPRILKEAAKLFFKRKLHVWFRPEVIHTSIGRNATIYER